MPLPQPVVAIAKGKLAATAMITLQVVFGEDKTMDDYADRKLAYAEVEHLSVISETPDYVVRARIGLQYTALDGTDLGPAVTIELATVCATNSTIPDAESALLAAALALLKRVSSETPESLQRVLSQTRSPAKRDDLD